MKIWWVQFGDTTVFLFKWGDRYIYTHRLSLSVIDFLNYASMGSHANNHKNLLINKTNINFNVINKNITVTTVIHTHTHLLIKQKIAFNIRNIISWYWTDTRVIKFIPLIGVTVFSIRDIVTSYISIDN